MSYDDTAIRVDAGRLLKSLNLWKRWKIWAPLIHGSATVANYEAQRCLVRATRAPLFSTVQPALRPVSILTSYWGSHTPSLRRE